MMTCPVEGVHKCIEALGQTLLAKSIFDPEDRRDHAAGILRKFLVGTVDPEHRSLLLTGHAEKRLASIKLGCLGADRPGTFAHALNALLRRRVVPCPTRSREAHLFNFTYVSSYECHDQRFGVFTCYGTLEPGRDRPQSLPTDFLRYVEIRPVGHLDAWYAYAEELKAFLNEASKNREAYDLRVFGDDNASLMGRAIIIWTGQAIPSPYLAEYREQQKRRATSDGGA
jgi:hypothetical protein